ncbi:MAG: SPOR domain-containing protein [Bacteroidota bacterium]
MRYLFIFIALFFTFSTYAQDTNSVDSTHVFSSLRTIKTEEQGSIHIYQDTLITELIGRHIQNNEKQENSISGWRIQIYNSTGKETRSDALQVRSEFLSQYPDLKTYVIYQPPIFKIRVGDFRTREEAYYYYKLIIKDYPISYMIKDDIILPELHDDSK